MLTVGLSAIVAKIATDVIASKVPLKSGLDLLVLGGVAAGASVVFSLFM